MRAVVLLLLTWLGLAAHAQAPACRPDAEGSADWRACAEQAPEGSPLRLLAYMNLAEEARLAGDVAQAARYYDETRAIDGRAWTAGAAFHALRADVYRRVGRLDEALPDAHIAVRLAETSANADADAVYALVLPVLHAAADPAFAATLEAFLALQPDDWRGWSNRAALYSELGDHPAAAAAARRAVDRAPDEPVARATLCAVLARAGERADAVCPRR